MAGKPGKYINGISTKENLAKWADYANKNSYKSGGGGYAVSEGQLANLPPHRSGDDPALVSPTVWSARQGGKDDGGNIASMMSGKSAGQGSGVGLKQYAKHMKSRYP